jgi:hypothetical protein
MPIQGLLLQIAVLRNSWFAYIQVSYLRVLLMQSVWIYYLLTPRLRPWKAYDPRWRKTAR